MRGEWKAQPQTGIDTSSDSRHALKAGMNSPLCALACSSFCKICPYKVGWCERSRALRCAEAGQSMTPVCLPCHCVSVLAWRHYQELLYTAELPMAWVQSAMERYASETWHGLAIIQDPHSLELGTASESCPSWPRHSAGAAVSPCILIHPGLCSC